LPVFIDLQDNLDKLAKIDIWEMQQAAAFLQRLDQTLEADGGSIPGAARSTASAHPAPQPIPSPGRQLQPGLDRC
jgi:hypothetical protein